MKLTKERGKHLALITTSEQRMGGTPSNAIMVGDRDKDIVAGHNAGTDTVLFCSVGHQQHYKLEKLIEHIPTYIISEFTDLLKIVHSNKTPRHSSLSM